MRYFDRTGRGCPFRGIDRDVFQELKSISTRLNVAPFARFVKKHDIDAPVSRNA